MPKRSEVVVITGASGGVGRVAARRFAADGAKVAVNYAKSEKEASAAEHTTCEASVPGTDLCRRVVAK